MGLPVPQPGEPFGKVRAPLGAAVVPNLEHGLLVYRIRYSKPTGIVTNLCREWPGIGFAGTAIQKTGKRCELDNITLFVGEFGNRCTLG